MNEDFDIDHLREQEPSSTDPAEQRARQDLVELFEKRQDGVFFSRQLEVMFEGTYFHWITNRALRYLAKEGPLKSNELALSFGGAIKTYWHGRNRYHKRAESQLIKIVDLYSGPTVGGALGHHGELLTLEGFAKKQFPLRGRHTAEYAGQRWTKTDHNLDMIVERDGLAYGVEVKNTLSYIDKDEFDTKIEICEALGIIPVFAVRMLPGTWIRELYYSHGGFALIFQWQLYPYGHKSVADRVKSELGLPVDCPQSLYETTMTRFTNWHEQRL